MNELPETIISGWPEKTFRFTGEWEETRTGGRRGAARNRRLLFLPIYQAEDGERICVSRFSRLTPVAPDRAEARDGEDDSSAEVLCGRTD